MRHDLLHAMTVRAEAFLEYLPGALDGHVRDTHQTRVAARRLIETLPLSGPAGGRLARQIREVRRALGAGREMDVTLALLAEEAARRDWPPALVRRVRAHVEAARDAQRADAREALDRVDESKLRRGIRAAGAGAAEMTPARVKARLQAREAERASALARAVRAAGAIYDPERLHHVRIAAKKLRYTLEVVGEVIGGRTAKRVARLRDLQEVLGRLHDLQVLQKGIREVEGALVPGRGRVARGLSRMAEALEVECRALHADALRSIARGVKT